MTIYIALPTDPLCYDRGYRISWSQIYSFIYKGLVSNFPNVRVYPYNYKGQIPLQKNDVFITTLSDEPIINHILNFNRCILIDNNNFDVTKWKYGKFSKYGYESKASKASRFNEHIRKSYAQFVKTNDVAIDKWNNNHEDIYEYKKWYIDNNVNVRLMQHPIDKKFYGSFFDKNKRFEKARMAIYYDGLYKNAKELIALLNQLGYKQGYDFDVFSSIDMSKPKQYLDKYMIFAHTSFSEGFPYLLNELFTMGMIPFAHEEWWNGYGNDFTKWSYDPNKIGQNVVNLKFIFDENNLDLLHEKRIELWNKHINRTDNNWDYFVGELVKTIKEMP